MSFNNENSNFSIEFDSESSTSSKSFFPKTSNALELPAIVLPPDSDDSEMKNHTNSTINTSQSPNKSKRKIFIRKFLSRSTSKFKNKKSNSPQNGESTNHESITRESTFYLSLPGASSSDQNLSVEKYNEDYAENEKKCLNVNYSEIQRPINGKLSTMQSDKMNRSSSHQGRSSFRKEFLLKDLVINESMTRSKSSTDRDKNNSSLDLLSPSVIDRNSSIRCSYTSVSGMKLKLYLICGENLSKVSKRNVIAPNAFVKFKQDDLDLGKSKIFRGSINPTWDSKHVLRIKKLDEPLELRVFHHHNSKNQLSNRQTYLGHGLINLYNLENLEEYSDVLELTDETKTLPDGDIGLIHYRIILDDQTNADNRSLNGNSLIIDKQDSYPLLIEQNPLNVSKFNMEQRFNFTLRHSDKKRTQDLNQNASKYACTLLDARLPWKLEYILTSSAFSNNCLSLNRQSEEDSSHDYNLKADYNDEAYYYSAILHVVIVSVKNLPLIYKDSPNKKMNLLPSSMVKLEFGRKEYNTKLQRNTTKPKFNEQFEFKINHSSVYSNFKLTLFHVNEQANNWEREQKVGIGHLDLTQLPFDMSQMWDIPLYGLETSIRIIATITGLTNMPVKSRRRLGEESQSQDQFKPIDVCPIFCDIAPKNFTEVLKMIYGHYSLFRTFECIKDVGWIQIKILKAYDLDKSEAFCRIYLPNKIVRTQIVKGTNDHEWNRTFVMPVNDIHQSVKIGVYELNEGTGGEHKLVGQIIVPLLKIKNGKRTCYILRSDKYEFLPPKRIVFEMFFVYNQIRASINTLRYLPEEDFMILKKKFRIKHLVDEHVADIKANIERLKIFINEFKQYAEKFQIMRSWTLPWFSLVGLTIIQITIWTIEIYMIPLIIAFILIFNGLAFRMRGFTENYLPTFRKKNENSEESNETQELNLVDEVIIEDEENEQTNKDKSGLKVIFTKVAAILLTVQNKIDSIASFLEKLSGPFSWEVPWLSRLGIYFLLILSMILYLIPLRGILSLYTFKVFIPIKNPPKEPLNYILRFPSMVDIDRSNNIKPGEKNLGSSLSKKKIRNF